MNKLKAIAFALWAGVSAISLQAQPAHAGFIFNLTVTGGGATPIPNDLFGTGHIEFAGTSGGLADILDFGFTVTGPTADSFVLADLAIGSFSLNAGGTAITALSVQTAAIVGQPVLTLGPVSANYEFVLGLNDIHSGSLAATSTAVSAPGPLTLFGLGLACLAYNRRRKRVI